MRTRRPDEEKTVLGALCGDIIGSVYEQDNIKTKDFPLFSPKCHFTDDTVLTAAIADSLIHDRAYAPNIKRFYGWYPKAGYGYMFSNWARSEVTDGYNSYGNGSAMRVSPIAWAFDRLDDVLTEARKSSMVTHNHPEGVKGAEAIAGAIFLARTSQSKDDIRAFWKSLGYDLSFSLALIRPDYHFDATCQGSVPQACVAFLESTSFEDAIRNAISIGGDSDTIAAMTGGIAEAFYGCVPTVIATQTKTYLDSRLAGILELFETKFMPRDR